MAEIAPAHDVRILCGAHEIAGAAFCSGLYSLLSEANRPWEDGKVSYRPSDIDTHLPHDSSTNPAESSLLNFTKFVSMNSQNIITSWLEEAPKTYAVGELLDMFHTYTALQRHDRIYALVSMSSDGHLSAEGILPDYKVPWKVLFTRLIRSIIGASALLTTWNHIDTAVIEARGVRIGSVKLVLAHHLGMIDVHISLNSLPTRLHGWKTTLWRLQPTAKAIKEGDMVCALDGFASPTIVRKLNDYFVVVALSATPLPTNSSTLRANEKASYMREFDFSYSFLLVWDWTSDPSHMPMEYADLPDEINQFPSKGSRLCNISLISAMGGWNQNTKSCLERAIHWYEGTTSEESMEKQTILALLKSLVAACDHNWTEDERWLWIIRKLRTAPQTRKEYSTIQDLTHTVASLRALGIIKLTPEATEVKSLLHMATESAKFTEEDVLAIIELGQLGVLIPLLERIDNFPLTRETMPSLVTRATGWGGQDWDAEEVLKAVIDHKGPGFITAEAVMAVVSERDGNDFRLQVALPVMRLFLERKGSSIITQQVVEAAARQSDAEFGFAITQLFYEHVGDRIITQGAVDAAACNRDIRRGAVLLRYLLDRIDDVQITDNIVKAFAEKKEALENLEFLLKKFDFPITENMVAAMIVNPKQAPSLLRLLLDSGRDAIPITSDTIAKANGNQFQRQKILQIIKDNRPDDQQIQTMILEALKENDQEDKEVPNLSSESETDSEEDGEPWQDSEEDGEHWQDSEDERFFDSVRLENLAKARDTKTRALSRVESRR